MKELAEESKLLDAASEKLLDAASDGPSHPAAPRVPEGDLGLSPRWIVLIVLIAIASYFCLFAVRSHAHELYTDFGL